MQKSLRNFQHICQSSRKHSSYQACLSTSKGVAAVKEFQIYSPAAGFLKHTVAKYPKMSFQNDFKKSHFLNFYEFKNLNFRVKKNHFGYFALVCKTQFSGKFHNFTVTIHNINAQKKKSRMPLGSLKCFRRRKNQSERRFFLLQRKEVFEKSNFLLNALQQ